MKFLSIIFLLTISNSAFCEAEPEVPQKVVSDDLISFMDKFNKAVIAHDEKLIFKMLDKTYRREQLKFLQGNKKQLIDELFSGNNEAGEWTNLNVSEITQCWMYNNELLEDGNYSIWLELELENNIISVELLVQINKNPKKWGIVGARG